MLDVTESQHTTIKRIVREVSSTTAAYIRGSDEEDLAQEAWVEVLENLHKFAGQCPFKCFVARIARTACFRAAIRALNPVHLRVGHELECSRAVHQVTGSAVVDLLHYGDSNLPGAGALRRALRGESPNIEEALDRKRAIDRVREAAAHVPHVGEAMVSQGTLDPRGLSKEDARVAQEVGDALLRRRASEVRSVVIRRRGRTCPSPHASPSSTPTT